MSFLFIYLRVDCKRQSSRVSETLTIDLQIPRVREHLRRRRHQAAANPRRLSQGRDLLLYCRRLWERRSLPAEVRPDLHYCVSLQAIFLHTTRLPLLFGTSWPTLPGTGFAPTIAYIRDTTLLDVDRTWHRQAKRSSSAAAGRPFVVVGGMVQIQRKGARMAFTSTPG